LFVFTGFAISSILLKVVQVVDRVVGSQVFIIWVVTSTWTLPYALTSF
jgi:uncharacterized protein (DUF697 family)